MKYIITFALLISLLCSSARAEHQIRYQVDKTYYDVVAAVERLVNEKRRVPFKVPNLPALIEGKDIRIQTDFRPTLRHYVVNITLENPIGKLHTFNNTIEVWGKKDHYLIQHTVNIGWGGCNRCRWVAGIKQRILDKAECAVLLLEKGKIVEYAARIETVKVEQPITWSKIGSDTFDLITLLIAKLNDVQQNKEVVQPKVKSAPKTKTNK